MSKMYILVREIIVKQNRGIAINSVGHASLKCYLDYNDNPQMKDWLFNSWKKVTCVVSDDELLDAVECTKHHVNITESALDGNPLVGVAFVPMEEFPPIFKTFKLFN